MTLDGKQDHVGAQVYYELRIVGGPLKFSAAGYLYDLDGRDYTAIVRVVQCGARILNEETVAIVGSASGSWSSTMLQLRDYLNARGLIRISRDLMP